MKESELSKNEMKSKELETLKKFIDNHQEGFFIIKEDSNIIYGNQKISDIFGVEKKEFEKYYLHDFLAPEDRLKLQDIARKQPDDSGFIDSEFWIIRKDGERRLIKCRCRTLTDDDEIKLIISALDITDSETETTALNFHIEFDKIIKRISTDFINLPVDEIDMSIGSALKILARFTGSRCCQIIKFNDDMSIFTITHSWCSSTLCSIIYESYPTKNLDYFFDSLQQFEPIVINDIDNLPNKAKNFKRFYKQLNVKSVILIPMFLEGKLYGAMSILGFQLIEEKQFDVFITLSRTLTHIFVNALDRRIKEIELLEHKKYFQKLYENLPDAYQSLDSDGKLIMVNKVWLKMLGYSEEEVIGQEFSKLLKPGQLDIFQGYFRKFKKQGEISGIVYDIMRKDNSILTIEADGVISYDEEGNFKQSHCILRDVTEKNLLTQKLREIDERYSILFNNANESLLVLEISEEVKLSNFVDANNKANHLLGYTKEEFLEISPIDLIPQNEMDKAKQIHQQILIDKTALFEFQLLTKDKKQIPVEISANLNVQGNQKFILFVIRDLTHSNQIEKEMKEYQKRLEETVKKRTLELEKLNENLKQEIIDGQYKEKEISSFYDAAQAVLESNIFKETALSIFQTCKEMIGAKAGYVALLSKDGLQNEIIFLDSGGLSNKVDPTLQMPICELSEQIYHTGEVVYDNNFSSNGWIKSLPSEHQKLQNVLMTPLKIKSKPVGLIGLSSKPGGFTQNDVRLAAVFSDIAAIALQNSQSMELLGKSENRYKALFEDSSISLCEGDGSQLKEYLDDLRSSGVTNFRKYFQEHPEDIQKCRGLVKIIDVNKAASDLLKAKSKEELLSGLDVIFTNDSYNKFQEKIIGLADGERKFGVETTLRTLTGEVITVFLKSIVPEFYKESLAKIFITIINITQRKKFENALKESREHYLQLFNSFTDAVFIRNFIEGKAPSNFIDANNAACEMLGYTREEFHNLSYFDIRDPSQEELIVSSYDVKTHGGTRLFERTLIAKDGRKIPVEVNSNLAEINGNKIIISSMRDITNRKESEEKILFQSSLLNQIRNAVVAIDMDLKITSWNKFAERLFQYSYEESLGKIFHELICPKGHKRIMDEILKILKLTGHWEGEFTAKRKNDEEIPTYITFSQIKDNLGELLGYVGVAIDIKEQKDVEEEKEKLQLQLFQSQKMDAINRMTNEVANEFSNQLTVIQGYLSLLMKNTKDNLLYNYIMQANNAAVKSTNLIQQLMLFGQKQSLTFNFVNVNMLIIVLQKMIGWIFKDNIIVDTDLAPDLWTIWGDEGNLENMMTNLLIYSKEAMPNGGKLSIKTSNLTIDENKPQALRDIEINNFIRIVLEDTGVGIEKEDIHQIFEPVYDQRQFTEGTKFNLSVVYNIVKQHNGWIDVYSEPGKGTTFKIYLPKAEKISNNFENR